MKQMSSRLVPAACVLVAGCSEGCQGESADLAVHLRSHERLVQIGESSVPEAVAGSNPELVAPSDLPAVRSALEGTDAQTLVKALQRHRLEGMLIEPSFDSPTKTSLLERVRRLEPLDGLQGVYLAPAAALYRREARSRAPPRSADLAPIARRILLGEQLPAVGSFPEELRRPRNVEVIVMLRDGGRPRLWRSARANSLAEGLVTASAVAARRWRARRSVMGQPLREALDKLEVEVSLLREDGTFAVHTPTFIEQAVTDQHGVGYERRESWDYVIPELMPDSAVNAYRELLQQRGVRGGLDRRDLRLYRLTIQKLSSSPPP